jgi:hypothetical protein
MSYTPDHPLFGKTDVTEIVKKAAKTEVDTKFTPFIKEQTFRNFYRHLANLKRKAFYEKRSFKPLDTKEWHKRFVLNFFHMPAVWKPMTSKKLKSAAYKQKMIMFDVFGPPTTSFHFMEQPSPMFQLPPPSIDKDFDFFMPKREFQVIEALEAVEAPTEEYLRSEMLIITGITELETFNKLVDDEKKEARDMTEIEAMVALHKAADDEENDKTAALEDQKMSMLAEKAAAENIVREEYIARDVEIAEDEGLQILAAAFKAFVDDAPVPKEPKASPPNPPRPSLFIKVPKVQEERPEGKYACSHCKKHGHTRASCKDYKAMKAAEAAWAAPPQKKHKYSCSHCKFGGHTRAKCKDYKAMMASYKPSDDTEEE